ncbi:HD domain-containing protein [Haloglycomyces albus]|uniref:HD domain-containing protein n=1 Tax=Haloglycomyces albus TaxID=526067 RepID=UPI00046D137B
MGSSPIDLDVWGKSRGSAVEIGRVETYPLACHLQDTAAFTGQIWDGYLSHRIRHWLSEQLKQSEDDCRRFLMLLAGLHDI